MIEIIIVLNKFMKKQLSQSFKLNLV